MIQYPVYPESSPKNHTWRLEDAQTAVNEYQTLVDEHILLVLTNTFKEGENKDRLIKFANDLCNQIGAHSRQKVLLIDQDEIEHMLASVLNPKIQQTSSVDNLTTLRAFSVAPRTGNVIGLVKDRLSIRKMQQAFVKAKLEVKKELDNNTLPADFPAT